MKKGKYATEKVISETITDFNICPGSDIFYQGDDKIEKFHIVIVSEVKQYSFKLDKRVALLFAINLLKVCDRMHPCCWVKVDDYVNGYAEQKEKLCGGEVVYQGKFEPTILDKK